MESNQITVISCCIVNKVRTNEDAPFAGLEKTHRSPCVYFLFKFCMFNRTGYVYVLFESGHPGLLFGGSGP